MKLQYILYIYTIIFIILFSTVFVYADPNVSEDIQISQVYDLKDSRLEPQSKEHNIDHKTKAVIKYYFAKMDINTSMLLQPTNITSGNLAKIEQNASISNQADINQNGNNNQLIGAKSQSEYDNDKPAYQKANNGSNAMEITQEGNNNKIGLYQKATQGNNTAKITQEGYNNEYIVFQNGSTNETDIYQSGEGNIDPLIQNTQGGTTYYSPHQVGSNNEIWFADENARILKGEEAQQTSFENGNVSLVISQWGDDNLAGLQQIAVGDSYAQLEQEGDSNRMGLTQGDFQDSSESQQNEVTRAVQIGDQNQASLVQDSQGNNSVRFTQHGDLNQIESNQSSLNENITSIEQMGSNNLIDIRQNTMGSANQLSIYQTTSNSAVLNQIGYGINTAEINQY